MVNYWGNGPINMVANVQFIVSKVLQHRWYWGLQPSEEANSYMSIVSHA